MILSSCVRGNTAVFEHNEVQMKQPIGAELLITIHVTIQFLELKKDL